MTDGSDPVDGEGAGLPAGGGAPGAPPAGAPRRSKPAWWIRMLQIVLTLVVTWFILDRVGLSLEQLRGLDPARWRPAWGLFLLASGVLLAGYALSAVLWGLMVRNLGGPRVGVVDACRVYFTANLGRYVPGKVWQIAGVAYLSPSVGASGTLGTAAAVLGQGFSLAGATLLGSAALLSGGQRTRELGVWALLGAAVLVTAVTVPAFLRRGVGLWFRLLRQEPPEALEPDASFGIRWLLLYTGNWVLYAGAFWLMVRSFGVEGEPLAVGSAFAAAYVLGYLAFFAPAGLGVREGFLVLFLRPLTGAAGAAAALAVIARLWMTLVEIVPAGLFAAGMVGGDSRTQPETKEEEVGE